MTPRPPAELPLYLVDAFADGPLRGNPAAVVLLPAWRWPSVRWMQDVAAEMNQSETAFVKPILGEVGECGLRWFTPAAEVELCGHATLAAAHVIWELAAMGGVATASPIVFHTLHRGTLTCTHDAGGRVAMDFPADPPEVAEAPAGLIETLGLRWADDVVAVARGRYDWIIELKDADAVDAASPDFAALARFDCRGVCITAQGRPPYDVVSRFFAPRLRVAEDPVTGSIHCGLAPYWVRRLARPPGKSLRCRQASARGGELLVRLLGDRVELAGHAVTIVRGSLLVPPLP